MNNLLYIHGFNSSPQSMKADLTLTYIKKNKVAVNFICPQVASSPREAVRQLEAIVNNAPHHNWSFVGSSLGGYFASYLAEKYFAKAVLINPAVRPFELLKKYIGEQTNPYTGETYHIKPSDMDDLTSLYQENIATQNYMVMVQTADEVLDYKQAADKYQNTQLIIQEGGDHSFINFEAMLPSVMRFLALQ